MDQLEQCEQCEQCEYFHKINRETAEIFLNQGGIGSYLVRPSSKLGYISLSYIIELNNKPVCQHSLIRPSPTENKWEGRLDGRWYSFSVFDEYVERIAGINKLKMVVKKK